MPRVIDFSAVPDIEPVPTAVYRAECIKGEDGVSQNNNDKIELQWKILEGQHAGRVLFDNLTFTEKSLGIVKAKLKGMGFDAKFNGEVHGADLVGIIADLHVSIQQSQAINEETGEPYPPRNNIRKYSAVKVSTADLLGKRK